MDSDIGPDASILSPHALHPSSQTIVMVDKEVLAAEDVDLMVEPTVSPLYRWWRRGVDLAFGLCGLGALFLLLLLLAPFMYLDSPGSLFYSQQRVGYRGKKFTIYKLRSMRPDAEQEEHAVWAVSHDNRVTHIGRFLRATHLDELPQALNILRGEMSLIGPRPEREEYALALEQSNPLYLSRLVVKPGLTGWSQVQYGYGSGSEEELIKLSYDLYYIKHQSFILDIRILLKTVVEVVLCHGT